MKNNDLNLEDAMSILENLRGSEGILGLDVAIDQAVENRKSQISTLQGEIKGFITVKRLISAIAERSGLTKLEAPPISNVISQSEIDTKAVEELNEEVKDRIANKKCSYKAPRSEGGKWCRRSLSSKTEQKHGYCKVHMVAVGILDENSK